MEEKTQNQIGQTGNPLENKAVAPQKDTTMAIIAYVVFFIPLLTQAKEDPFVKFHVKQGMILFVAWCAAGIISMVPFLGWTLAPFLTIFLIVLLVIGILNAAKGQQKQLPLIGKYGENFRI